MDLASYDYSVVFEKVFGPFFGRIFWLASTAGTVFLAFLFYCVIKYRLNPFTMTLDKLREVRIRFKLFSFLRWVIVDQLSKTKKNDNFEEYGFTVYCGRQGAGKTVSMVDYLNRMHEKFPNALIVTNFAYEFATHRMESWQDFFDIRNGIDGVIFAIDEIHSEYSNASWKDFPESILSEISQQRKQRVKIVATSQVYSRVVKQIREQCASVVQCTTTAGRWTFCKEYDAAEYEAVEGNAEKKKKKLYTIRKWSFVQSPFIRECFDTYEKIERLQKMEFLPRSER